MCDLSYRRSIYVQVNTQCCSLGEDAADLRLEHLIRSAAALARMLPTLDMFIING